MSKFERARSVRTIWSVTGTWKLNSLCATPGTPAVCQNLSMRVGVNDFEYCCYTTVSVLEYAY